MKVALVFLGRRGGGALYSLEMAKALSGRDEVLAVVSAQAENIAAWRASGLKLLEVDTYHDLMSCLVASLNVVKFWRIQRQIQWFGADIVYYPMTHTWTPIIQYLLAETPQIVTIHDPEAHSGEANIFLKIIDKLTLWQASGIVILSGAFKDIVRSWGFDATKIAVIPHGEFSYYSRLARKKEEHVGDCILFFGRISDYKGIEVLLEAFGQIVKRHPTAKLMLAGSGDLAKYRGQLAALPQQQVIVVNRWIADEEIHQFFVQAQFVVLPYIDATQSGVIAAAYGFGLPVIASRVGGLAEQVVDGTTGFLVQPGNVEELAERCIKLLDDSELVRQLGENALAFSQEELSWEKLSRSLHQFLQTFAPSPAKAKE